MARIQIGMWRICGGYVESRSYVLRRLDLGGSIRFGAQISSSEHRKQGSLPKPRFADATDLNVNQFTGKAPICQVYF